MSAKASPRLSPHPYRIYTKAFSVSVKPVESSNTAAFSAMVNALFGVAAFFLILIPSKISSYCPEAMSLSLAADLIICFSVSRICSCVLMCPLASLMHSITLEQTISDTSLKQIGQYIGMHKTDYDFAKFMIEMPIEERLKWISEYLYDTLGKDIGATLEDYQNWSGLLDMLYTKE